MKVRRRFARVSVTARMAFSPAVQSRQTLAGTERLPVRCDGGRSQRRRLTEFLHRNCPACGASQPCDEVTSDPRAETRTYDDLRSYWSGLFRKKLFFTYARCGGCGLMYAPVYFTGDQLAELYSDMAPNMYDVPGPAVAATQRGYFDVAARAGDLDGGYLEIGPDLGYIVGHSAREGGFDHFWLVEPNLAVHPELAAATLGKPHTILAGMSDLSAVPAASVGLAVMIHVLDHILDPAATLAEVRSKLRPGGVILIVTHNEKSWLRRIMGRRFPPFCLQHPELYSPASISGFLERTGFASVRVERSRNYFPVSFMLRQAAYAAGLDIARLPLSETILGLKLGNMIIVARA